jgi:hypothetical protein
LTFFAQLSVKWLIRVKDEPVTNRKDSHHVFT